MIENNNSEIETKVTMCIVSKPEEIPHPTPNNLQTSHNRKRCLLVQGLEFEIQYRLQPRESQHNVQDLHFCFQEFSCFYMVQRLI